MTTPQPRPAGAEDNPWVLTISHRHGDNTTLHPTEAAAHAALAEFARRWWTETGMPAGPPDDDEEAVRLYFERQEAEGYTITQAVTPGAEAPGAGPADAAADAMRALVDAVLGAARPRDRQRMEAQLADLLDLATDNLSADARAGVIREALNEADGSQGTRRSWEVSLGTRIVTASSAEQAARIASAEWHEETSDKHYQPDPNEHYEVRPAHSRGHWQLVHT